MIERTASEQLIDQGRPSMIGETVNASADCRRVAYVARAGMKQVVVVDGQEWKHYDKIEKRSLVFSPDSQRVAYVARVWAWVLGFIPVGERHVVVIDGQEGSKYDGIIPSAEKWGVIFDSPHQLHYIAHKGNEFYLVEERLT